jgi:hypothetical protein
MVSSPISEALFEGATKLRTYEKIDLFLKDSAHLILKFRSLREEKSFVD